MMLGMIRETIYNHADEWGVSDLGEINKIHFLKIAGHALVANRLVMLAFINNLKSPSFIIKIARSDGGKQIIINEHEVLRKVLQANSDLVGIPKPLWCDVTHSNCFSIETAIVGKLMGNMRSPWLTFDDRIAKKKYETDIARGLEWLSEFHSNPRMVVADQNEVNHLITEAIIGKSHMPDLPDHLQRTADLLISYFSEFLRNREIPLVIEHGDYWAGNIYHQINGSIGVIDWADCGFNKLPLYDAPFFVTSYCFGFQPKNGDRLWMYRNLLETRGGFSDYVHDVLKTYYRALALSDVDEEMLIGVAVFRRAIHEFFEGNYHKHYQEMTGDWLAKIIKTAAGKL